MKNGVIFVKNIYMQMRFLNNSKMVYNKIIDKVIYIIKLNYKFFQTVEKIIDDK